MNSLGTICAGGKVRWRLDGVQHNHKIKTFCGDISEKSRRRRWNTCEQQFYFESLSKSISQNKLLWDLWQINFILTYINNIITAGTRNGRMMVGSHKNICINVCMCTTHTHAHTHAHTHKCTRTGTRTWTLRLICIENINYILSWLTHSRHI